MRLRLRALPLHSTYTLKSKSIQYNNALFYIVLYRILYSLKVLLNKHHTKFAASQTIFLTYHSHKSQHICDSEGFVWSGGLRKVYFFKCKLTRGSWFQKMKRPRGYILCYSCLRLKRISQLELNHIHTSDVKSVSICRAGPAPAPWPREPPAPAARPPGRAVAPLPASEAVVAGPGPGPRASHSSAAAEGRPSPISWGFKNCY